MRRDGYGQVFFRVNGKTVNRAAHRVAWEKAHGPIPDGMWVLHRCDNKRCINPEHLFLGTNRDNQIDCVLKGRNTFYDCPGELNPNSRLTREQVNEIRNTKWRWGVFSELARKHGVTHTQIRRIALGESW